jgi:hypothetical protein
MVLAKWYKLMRKLNRRLGQKADFLNLIPGDLVLPWLVLALGSYGILNGIFGVNWIWTAIIVLWECLVWLLLAGKTPHRFFGQMVTPPKLARSRLRQSG